MIEQLRQLAVANFRITFVSNAPKLNKDGLSAVLPHCRLAIIRRNVGFDFGAYKDGITSIGDLVACDRLLLMNDSVYGPFWPISEFLDKADPAHADFWGITDSWDTHYHVQSYFLMFFRSAFTSRAFKKFWQRMPYVNSKRWVIRFGEIKLTQELTRIKLRASVLCPYWEVAKIALQNHQALLQAELPAAQLNFLNRLQDQIIGGEPLNAPHYFWDTLISDFKCPFLKRELIQINPVNIMYAWKWEDVIRPISAYNLELIWRHLKAS